MTRTTCLLFAIVCSNLAGCGWSPVPVGDVQVDWDTLYAQASVLFDVSCELNNADDLDGAYRTDDYDALIREAPGCQRYMLRTDLETGEQHLYFAGANIARPLCFIGAFTSTEVYDPELGILVHHKFCELADSAADDVEPILDPGSSVAVWGYSSGGGVASLVAAKLIHRGYDVVSVTTFGQAAVTDIWGANVLRSVPLLRVVAGRDWATIARNGYVHFGDELVLLRDNQFAYLHMGQLAYTVSTGMDAGPADFFCHTNYMPYLEAMTHSATLVNYRIPIIPMKTYGLFPCEFSILHGGDAARAATKRTSPSAP